MASHPAAQFLAGVIEGFYGQPWSHTQRLELFDWLSAWGLNTYLYAPKDDLHHRALWREPYPEPDAAALRELIRACHQRGLRFLYALSPGLDLRYTSDADLDRLRLRFDQLLQLGCRDFALLFDDIPDQIHPADLQHHGSLAAAQAHVANTLLPRIRQRYPESRLLFCPTPYCGRMAAQHLGGKDYLPTLGRVLHPDIDVFWTGPEIISREITAAHARELATVLRRKPLLWDNLHANDYDGRRFFTGPYSGRPPELRAEVGGLLSNPNTEFPLNYVPLHTLAAFIRSGAEWDPRAAYLDAMSQWLPRFATVNQPVALEDLILLGDAFYLPHEEGPQAEALFQQARALLNSDPATWDETTHTFRRQAQRLRNLCARLTELRDRPLFHALSRRLWDLREELDLLDGYVRLKSENPAAPARSDFHLPGTFRGGFVARLQSLLLQQPDGTFTPTIPLIAP